MEKTPGAEKPTLANVLKDLCALGITEVYASFDGSCDEGEIGDIMAKAGKAKAETNPAIDEVLLDLFWNTLEAQHGGWEINDGAYGHVHLDPLTGKIKVDFHYKEPGDSEDY